MWRWGGRVAVALALGVVFFALVLPVFALFVRSFQVREVEAKDGRTWRAVGEVDELEVPGRGRVLSFKTQAGPGQERQSHKLPVAQAAEVRTRFSLDHYRVVLGDPHVQGLVRNSLLLALGAVVAALLLGLPVAWLLARTDLPGRRLFAVLCLGPAILPPFFVAMGGARAIGSALHALLGISGGTLQLVNAAVVFGFVFFPLVALLVGRALAVVPVGLWEAAVSLGGRREALRRVVVPAVLPAVFGASTLVFVLALSDFAVPDLLGFMLPASATPMHVFPTEILLQWKQHGNTGRAVATGAPFVFVTMALLALSFVLLRRSPVIGGGEGRRGRPPVHLSSRGRVAGWTGIVLVLAVTFLLPLWGVGRWAKGGGESTRQTDGVAVTAAPREGALFDIAGAFERTPGAGQDLERWIKSGLGAALLSVLVATILARWALRGGRLVRALVLTLGALPLAVPGLVMTVGTLILWRNIDLARGLTVDLGIFVFPIPLPTNLPSVFVLTARFLPFALLAAWLALREIRRGHEEAAALLGAGAPARAVRIWGPLALRGILGGGLVVLVLALREIDAVILVDPRIFPLRLYDKIHFTRLADEANLAFVYVGILLVPALIGALLLGVLGRRRR